MITNDAGPNRGRSGDLNMLDPDAVSPDALEDENPQGIIRDFEAAQDSSDMDSQPDGDRQLVTDSDALDGGLNDSSLGADEFSENPPREQ